MTFKLPDKIANIPFIKKITENKNIMRLISYLFVGGLATIVEWAAFFLLNSAARLNPTISTALAFIFSTLANWILGRLITFRENVNKKNYSDIIGVFIVSVIGLALNLLLMKFLIMGLAALFTGTDAEHGLIPLCAKIIATVIVFVWNYLTRKLVIYREK